MSQEVEMRVSSATMTSNNPFVELLFSIPNILSSVEFEIVMNYPQKNAFTKGYITSSTGPVDETGHLLILGFLCQDPTDKEGWYASS
jgi:hypothetical protein